MTTFNKHEQDYRTGKIAKLVRGHMRSQGMSQERLARQIGVNVAALRSRLIYRTGAVPDWQMLASVSVALGFDPRWLPGLLDGTYGFDDDPHDLPDTPPQRVAHSTHGPITTPETREAARDRELRVAKVKIRQMEQRITDLESFVHARLGEQRRAG
ncbi:helix-turn-helix transcriptional regulator [Amycolatopsis sp. NPDC021455]|uniref:helix-turn-helix domain-containing protein n=1 Tax=Amycolatopsis sp. NPDC021455 TaxID=3154901 RepID=UPI0033F04278